MIAEADLELERTGAIMGGPHAWCTV